MSERRRAVIAERSIRRMVADFHDCVRADPQLGPIFESRLANRWSEHEERLVGFWISVLLQDSGYPSDPRRIHASIAGLPASHFDRWLGLFAATLDDHFGADVAGTARAKAVAGRLTPAIGPRQDAFGPG